MKWNANDMDTYLQAREYIDTAIISLIPISWGTEVKGTVSMGEFITIISHELEKQFHGRVVLFPAFTYFATESNEQCLHRLQLWEDNLLKEGFKHVVYLTSDGKWRQVEGELQGLHIWLPSIPLEHLDSENRNHVIHDQMKQLIPIVTNRWQSRT
ncbi:YpiF family protein [Halalkalibacter hemicellulosilyticus]|uniref:TPR repeat protein n=1 Tax=Halalkalibacter hemicellulosilyticusJCM 9152 TaxID=1236971 RepID=W4QAN6_9BACI|nr:YpiF family protein [Halalkalibacter hemicellulosilyticus]GAE29032.1 TPR repeat protein [Halalkalibacter hemicellulosilyticusJCM 9152]